jgi:sulfoxide reductase heme-binding subunit YedZ
MFELATATGGHLFWITSRAAGTAALLLSSAAVGMGLMQSGLRSRRRSPELRVVHEALSIATIAAIAVHGATLLGDGFLAPSLADVTIPFVSGYQRLWTTLGILSGWSLIVFGVSYYARASIGVARWRRIHRFTALAWIAGLVHSLGEGTDAGEAWFLGAVAIAVVPALSMLALRHLGSADGRAAA